MLVYCCKRCNWRFNTYSCRVI